RLLQLSPYIDPNGYNEGNTRINFLTEAARRGDAAGAELLISFGANDVTCLAVIYSVEAVAWRRFLDAYNSAGIVPDCSQSIVTVWASAALTGAREQNIAVAKYLYEVLSYEPPQSITIEIWYNGRERFYETVSVWTAIMRTSRASPNRN